MAGFSSSYLARGVAKGSRLIAVTVVALTPALASARAATAAAPPAPSIACQTIWLATTGGSWSDPANWSAGVPTSATNACINKAGTYTVHVTGIQNAAALVLGASNGAQTLSIEGTCDQATGELHLGASSVVNAHGTVVLTDTGDCQFSWLDQTSGTLSNAGTITVANSGTTQDRFLYGDIVNSGKINIATALTSDDGGRTQTNTGTVTIGNGAEWLDSDAFHNVGGSLTTTGTGSFTDFSAPFVQGNGTTSGNVFVQDGSLAYTGTGASTIVTHGEVDLSGDIAAGQALTAEGSCSTGHAYLGIGAPWTNAGTVTLTDVGNCEYVWLDQTSGTLTNTGTIEIADTGTTQARYLYGDLANSGTINVDATLTSDDGGFTQTNTGTVKIADGAAWNDDDTFRNLGGSLSTLGTGSFDQLVGTFVQGAGTTSGNVVVDAANLSYTGAGASTIVAHGGVALAGDIATGQTLTVEGTCADGAAVVAAGAPVSNAGTITLTDTGNCASAGIAQTSGALTNTGTIHLDNSGTAQPRLLVGTLDNAGTLVLDAGTNLQAASGTITNEDAGTIETHLASTTKFGQLSDTGFVQLSGTLNIVRDGTYMPQTGRQFKIVTCTACSGSFQTIGGQSVNAHSAFAVSSTPTAVTITVGKAADLSLVASAPPTAASGSTFSYTFVVHNAGPKAATGITLTNKLASNVTFSSASPGCTRTGNQVVCALANLGKDKSATVTITVVAGASGKATDLASVTATSVDVTPADASAKVNVTIT